MCSCDGRLVRRAIVAAMLTCGIATSASGDGPRLGRPLTPEEVAPLDIDVAPDGLGLPAGSATAVDGVDTYVQKCASCHGLRGQGAATGPALVGGLGSLGTKSPRQTVGSYWPYATIVFDYVRRAMPYDRPMNLTDDETYGVTAYILWLNGIVGRDQVMDANTLPAVRMPNREGFVDAWSARPRP